MKTACEGARNHVARAPFRQMNINRLYALTQPSNHEAISLLQEMLKFDSVRFFLYFLNIN